MRDVVKTNVKRERDSKRTRRRKKNLPMYVFLILVLVLGIGILLSVTLLFNIDKITVNGDVDYSAETVIKASGVKEGDNLVRLDAKKAEKNILSSMVYIEEADVQKKYPDTLVIDLKKSVPFAAVEHEGKYILVSAKGKILDSVSEPGEGVMIVKGLEPSETRPGQYLASSNEQKTEIFTELFEKLSEESDFDATLIDMTDIYSMIINYEDRIKFELGNSNDLSYKLELANTVMKDISEDKKGTMVMVGANQISFRADDSKPKEKKKKIPIEKNDDNDETAEENEDGAEQWGDEWIDDGENEWVDEGGGEFFDEGVGEEAADGGEW